MTAHTIQVLHCLQLCYFITGNFFIFLFLILSWKINCFSFQFFFFLEIYAFFFFPFISPKISLFYVIFSSSCIHPFFHFITVTSPLTCPIFSDFLIWSSVNFLVLLSQIFFHRIFIVSGSLYFSYFFFYSFYFFPSFSFFCFSFHLAFFPQRKHLLDFPVFWPTRQQQQKWRKNKKRKKSQNSTKKHPSLITPHPAFTYFAKIAAAAAAAADLIFFETPPPINILVNYGSPPVVPRHCINTLTVLPSTLPRARDTQQSAIRCVQK